MKRMTRSIGTNTKVKLPEEEDIVSSHLEEEENALYGKEEGFEDSSEDDSIRRGPADDEDFDDDYDAEEARRGLLRSF